MADLRIPFTWTLDGSGPNAGGSSGAAWTPGFDAHELPITIELDDTPSNRAALRRLGHDRSDPDPSLSGRSGIDTALNEEQLAETMRSEAVGVGIAAETAVGFTVLNRMRRNRLRKVSETWERNAYAHGMAADAATEALAGRILRGDIADPTAGATHFYSPRSMREAPDPGASHDRPPDVERVEGVGHWTHRPAFSTAPDFHQVHVQGIDDEDFKFYRVDGEGPVS